MITGDDKEVLSVVLDNENGWGRHADMLRGVRINGARKVTKWIKKGISSKLNFLGDILQNKPKAGSNLEIKGKQFIF